MSEPVTVPPDPCPHPPTRLYAWTAFDGVFCVCCCDCGEPLLGALGAAEEEGENA